MPKGADQAPFKGSALTGDFVPIPYTVDSNRVRRAIATRLLGFL
jgi:hypothetical protein